MGSPQLTFKLNANQEMAPAPLCWATSLAFLVTLVSCRTTPGVSDCDKDAGDIYKYSYQDLFHHKTHSFNDYKGKVVLVTNVATYWGLTTSNYPPLNVLQEKYKDAGLVIVGFPCNQFGKQEPGGNADEIWNGIKNVRPGGGYEPNFPLSKKIDVNGKDADPFFVFLNGVCHEPIDEFNPKEMLFYDPLKNNDVRWNFEKYLIGKDGVPIKRYNPMHLPQEIEDDIKAALAV